ncbi:Polyphosphate kinase [Dorcoceras hygrometricum]|uniref:Polyphosphate kinase n=1 Tax=Dorcoceras hygrometricum TaxID=472368 RepID=A0A2Z7CCB8_9LAMI|nr:Polyphosphate kinase [Dorcoceras hygrometricum]
MSSSEQRVDPSAVDTSWRSAEHSPAEVKTKKRKISSMPSHPEQASVSKPAMLSRGRQYSTRSSSCLVSRFSNTIADPVDLVSSPHISGDGSSNEDAASSGSVSTEGDDGKTPPDSPVIYEEMYSDDQHVRQHDTGLDIGVPFATPLSPARTTPDLPWTHNFCDSENIFFGLTNRIMVKRLATSSYDPLGITDSPCKNQSVMVSVQYGPFNSNIPIGSMTIDKSRVARDPIAMHTSWNQIMTLHVLLDSIGYPCTRRVVNPRQQSIDFYMHRDITQSHRLMTPTESLGESQRLAMISVVSILRAYPKFCVEHPLLDSIATIFFDSNAAQAKNTLLMANWRIFTINVVGLKLWSRKPWPFLLKLKT